MFHLNSSNVSKKLALVLSGGGARGAYEAGVIHYLRTHLPPSLGARRSFDILCGSSVGAINTCFLAATNHNLEHQGKKLFEVWNNLKQADIYRRDLRAYGRFLGRRMGFFFGKIFGRKQTFSGALRFKHSPYRGLFDTSPLPVFLRNAISWKQIDLNIQNGSLRALSLTATNVHTGRLELFVNKHPSLAYSGHYLVHFGAVEPRHALASAALPIIFPAVPIGRNYYCDGGLRLNTPMSPAIQLGADKVLVIGLHNIDERAEKASEPEADNDAPPTTGEVIGQVLKSLFLDKLDYDLEQMERINSIIDWGIEVFGPDYLEKINRHLAEQKGEKDIAARGLKKLEVMRLFPSVDIRKIFAECVEDPAFMKHNVTIMEKMLLRMLDVDLKHGHDFLSFILFIPAYLKKMLELGYEDARKNHDQFVAFFES